MGLVKRLPRITIPILVSVLATFFLFAALAYLPGGLKGSLADLFAISSAEAQYSGGGESTNDANEGFDDQQSGTPFDPVLMPGGDLLCNPSRGRFVRECEVDSPVDAAGDLTDELVTLGNGTFYSSAPDIPGSEIYKLADAQGYITYSPVSSEPPFNPTVYINIPAYRDTIRKVKFCDNAAYPCVAP